MGLERALPGISAAIRRQLVGGQYGTGAVDPYKQANEVTQGEGYALKNEGEGLKNDLSRYILDATTNPDSINNAAAYAANVSPDKVAEFEFNRGMNLPRAAGNAGSASGLTTAETAALNQFGVNRYGSLTNDKGANDFAKGQDTLMQSGVAQAAAAAATDPNAKVLLAGGKAYEPFSVDDGVVLNKGTGAVGPTTALGTARIGTEVSKQRENNSTASMNDSRHGFNPGRGGKGGGTSDINGVKTLAKLPAERQYAEARKMALRENDIDLKNGADPAEALTVDQRTTQILQQAKQYANPTASKKGTPQWQNALNYAYDAVGDVGPELIAKGWNSEDVQALQTQQKNFKFLQDQAPKVRALNEADRNAWISRAVAKGWKQDVINKALGL